MPPRRDPRRGVGGVRGLAGVAGRTDHDDVGLSSAEQRALEGVDAVAPGEGEVEHVDAVCDGGVDRSDAPVSEQGCRRQGRHGRPHRAVLYPFPTIPLRRALETFQFQQLLLWHLSVYDRDL